MNIVQKDFVTIRNASEGSLTTAGRIGAGRGAANPEYPEFAMFTKAILHLTVTAVAGTATPTMKIDIEEEDPLSLGWHIIDSFTGIVAAGYTRKVLSDFAKNIRFNVSFTGTSPGFTFHLGAHLLTA